jgi:hypothetical protein
MVISVGAAAGTGAGAGGGASGGGVESAIFQIGHSTEEGTRET